MRARREFTWFISNEDMNYIIKIIKSFGDTVVLIGEVTDTVKHGEKKSRKQPVISSLVKGISGRGVRSAGIGYMNKKF